MEISKELEELFQQNPPKDLAPDMVFAEDELDEGDELDTLEEQQYPDEDEEVQKDAPCPADVHTPTPRMGRGMRKLPKMKDVTARITKIDEDQRLVYGWASIIKDAAGNLITDSQGDQLPEEELLKAAHYHIEHRNLGDSHRVTTGMGKIVESMVFTEDLKKSLGLPESFPTGWFIGVKVADDGVWGRVKSGELKEFSIGGTGTRIPL